MLIVTDFGQRIQTPWRDAFNKKTVRPLTASAKSSAIKQQDPVKESDAAFEHYSARHQLVDYERIATPEKERQVVRFAEQIMTSPAIAAHIEQSTEHAWRTMREQGFHHLPVIDHRQCLQGIISDRDLLNAGINKRSISDIMQSKVLSAARLTPIRDIAEVMTNYRIGALPLLDDENHIEGIITRHDILKAVMQQVPIELWI